MFSQIGPSSRDRSGASAPPPTRAAAPILDREGFLPLSQVVALVRTLTETDPNTLQSESATLLMGGLSEEFLRHVLTEKYDVKPARIDTDIHNQTAERARTIIEIISNAVDASGDPRNSIGRFGVGFYQILAHLNEPTDYVRVTTGNQTNGFFCIEFIKWHDEILVRTRQEEWGNDGTSVELYSSSFPFEEAIALTKKHLKYLTTVAVSLNGEVINPLTQFSLRHEYDRQVMAVVDEHGFSVTDRGSGMTPAVILSKLLVPKFSGKTPIEDQDVQVRTSASFLIERAEDNALSSGHEVIICVGGIVIENLPVTGINSVKTLVVNLPSHTRLGEERNEVAVDEITIGAVKAAVDTMVASQDVQAINSLTEVVAYLQGKSKDRSKECDMLSYLKEGVKNVFSDSAVYLPNAPGLERVVHSNAILLDSRIRHTRWSEIPEFKRIEQASGAQLFSAPLVENIESPIIEWRGMTLIDQRIVTHFAEDPTLINLYLRAHAKANADTPISLREKAEKPAAKSAQNFEPSNFKSTVSNGRPRICESFADFITHYHHLVGFANQEGALAVYETLPQRRKVLAGDVFREIISSVNPKIGAYFANLLLIDQCEVRTARTRRVEIESFLRSLLDSGKASALASVNKSEALLEALEATGGLPVFMEDKIVHFPGDKDDQEWVKNPGADLPVYLVCGIKGGKAFITESGRVVSGEVTALSQDRLLVIDEGSITLRSYDNVTEVLCTLETAHPAKEYHCYTLSSLLEKTFWTFPFNGETLFALKANGKNDIEIFRLQDGSRFYPEESLGSPNRVEKIHETTQKIVFVYEQATVVGGKASVKNLFVGEGGYRAETFGDDRPDDFDCFKYISDRVYREIEGTQVTLFLDGKPLLREDLPDGFTACTQPLVRWRGTRDEVVGHSLKVEHSKEVFETIVATSFRRVGDSYSVRPWIDSRCEVPCQPMTTRQRVFDGQGNKLFELPSGHVVKEKVLVGERKVFLVNDYGDSIHFINNSHRDVKEVTKITQYAVDEHGGRVALDLVNRDQNLHSWARLSNTLGEGWSVTKFKKEKRHTYENGTVDWYKVERFRIQDGNSRKDMVADSFFSIRHLPERELWRCTLDRLTPANPSTPSWLIDTHGTIVSEELVTLHSIPQQHGISSFWDTSDYESSNSYAPLTPGSPFSKEHADIIAAEINDSLSPNAHSVTLLLNRAFRFAGLSVEAFAVAVPLLARLDQVNPDLFRDRVLLDAAAQLSDLDAASAEWGFVFANRLLPPKLTEEQAVSFMQSFFKVFRDKLLALSDQEKQEVFNIFSEVRYYQQEYAVTGWNIVRHKTPIPSSLIPEKIRALVDFLRTEEAAALIPPPQGIHVSGDTEFFLSDLIRCKRLHESRMSSGSDNLGEVMKLLSTVKRQQGASSNIRREIIHSIHYQGVNTPYLFIRELVQNAHDAVIIEDKGKTDPEVHVHIFQRDDHEVTMVISDSVGMSLQQVLNYFLIPGESTKLEDSRTIGYFGHGLFTLFRGAKEVCVETSDGSGRVTRLQVTGAENANGLVVDLRIRIEEVAGDFRGTKIERTVVSRNPVVEAAYLKSATSTYCSLVPADVVRIILNGSPVNGLSDVLASIDISEVGRLTIYDAPNNVVTQRGLFVRNLDDNFDCGMYDVDKLLWARGYVLDVPESLPLTRSRNDLASRKSHLEKLMPYIRSVKVQAYLDIFRRDILRGEVIQLANLPYDFFYAHSGCAPQTLRDAESIARGEPLSDVTRYLEKGQLVQLLVHLPLAKLGDRTWSLTELKEAALTDAPPLNTRAGYDELPKLIATALLEGKRMYGSMAMARDTAQAQELRVADFFLDDWETQPPAAREIIGNDLESYRKLERWSAEQTSAVRKLNQGFPSNQVTFYRDPNSLAHANPLKNSMGWCLEHFRGWRMRGWQNPQQSDQELEEFYETWSHEYAHLLEQTTFTHNQDFFKQQARVLALLLHSKSETMKGHPDDFHLLPPVPPVAP